MTPDDLRRGAFGAQLDEIRALPEASRDDLGEMQQVLAVMNPSVNMAAFLDLRCQIQEFDC